MRGPRPQLDPSRRQPKPYTAADLQAALQAPEWRAQGLNELQAFVGPAEAVLVRSQPLSGTIYIERGAMDVSETLLVFGVERVVYRFESWMVAKDGGTYLVHHDPLTSARLSEQQDWACHPSSNPG